MVPGRKECDGEDAHIVKTCSAPVRLFINFVTEVRGWVIFRSLPLHCCPYSHSSINDRVRGVGGVHGVCGGEASLSWPLTPCRSGLGVKWNSVVIQMSSTSSKNRRCVKKCMNCIFGCVSSETSIVFWEEQCQRYSGQRPLINGVCFSTLLAHQLRRDTQPQHPLTLILSVLHEQVCTDRRWLTSSYEERDI